MRTVIVHDQFGVHLGCCMGLAFWTMLDPAGQPAACTFEDERAAREHVARWDRENDPDNYRYVGVECQEWAFPADLKKAGLSDLLGDMEADALRHAVPAGNA